MKRHVALRGAGTVAERRVDEREIEVRHPGKVEGLGKSNPVRRTIDAEVTTR